MSNLEPETIKEEFQLFRLSKAVFGNYDQVVCCFSQVMFFSTLKHNKYQDFANEVKQSFMAYHNAHDRLSI